MRLSSADRKGYVGSVRRYQQAQKPTGKKKKRQTACDVTLRGWIKWAKEHEPGALSELVPSEDEIHLERASKALQQDTFLDKATGKKIRRWHCIRVDVEDKGKLIQKTLWADIDTASEKHMRESFNQRHEAIGTDVESLKSDLAFWNAKQDKAGRPLIQMSFDWSK